MRRRLLLAAAGGAVMGLSAPPVDFVPAVFAGLAIMAFSLRDAPSGRAAAACAIVWATVAGTAGLRWVPEVIDRFTGSGPVVAALALLVLLVVQALAWGAGAAVAHAVRRRAGVPFELSFAGGVFVACAVPAVFPWSPASMLTPRPQLVQLAEVAGERGVSALAAGIAALGATAAAALLARESARRVAVPLACALALVAVADRWGAARMEAVAGQQATTVRVALVDQGASAEERDDATRHAAIVDRLRDLSARADRAGAELVVWAESAYPFPLERSTRAIRGGTGSPVAPGATAPRLIGLSTRDRGTGREYNSATLVEPDGSVQPAVDKLRLLWFGETIPLADAIPPLRGWFGRSGDLSAGSSARPLLLDGPSGEQVRLGILNCYEDMHTGSGRRVVREARPQLLVSMSNHAWFAGTSAPAMHERLAAIRSVELRTDVIRSANRGGAGWIDAAGRVRARRTAAGPGIVLAAPAVRAAAAAPTVYARFGDWPAWTAFALLTLVCAVRPAPGWRRGLGTRRRATSTSPIRSSATRRSTSCSSTGS